MKVIKPTTITSSNLVSSDATEAYSAWSSGTTYSLTNRVYLASTGRIYECIQAPNLNKSPDTNSAWWSDVGPMNKWAMFDETISTATTKATSLTVTMNPGAVNSLTMLGLTGGSVAVTMTDGSGGTVVYSKTVPLDGTVITDWYEYFFESVKQLEEIVLTDLPAYSFGYITVVLTGTDVQCGHMSVGTAYDLGTTEQGATAGIIDFSRKDTSATGVTTFVKRGYAKRVSLRMVMNTADIAIAHKRLADLRATPCTWIGANDTATYSPLLVWGFYRDFSIDISGPMASYCTLEIEGMT